MPELTTAKKKGGRPLSKWSKKAKERRTKREMDKPITPLSYDKRHEVLDRITDDLPRY